MPGFFDKMKSVATEKANEAKIRSQEAIETQQAKGKIGDLEGQKKKIFFEIGESVWTMYQNSAFDQEALTQQCQGVAALDAQVKEKEAELEEIHRRAEAALADQRTAAAASAAAVPASGGGTFCPNCGAATQGAKFCPSCGTKVA